MKNKSVILLTCAALLVTACAAKHSPENRPERQQIDPEQRQRQFIQFVERWDYNQDGLATCDDIIVQRSRLFKRLDDDSDGELSSAEYRYAKFEDKSFMFFTYDRVDSDASSAINIDEFVAISHSEFLHIDRDGDCMITAQEAMRTMRNIGRKQGAGHPSDGNSSRQGRHPPSRRGGNFT